MVTAALDVPMASVNKRTSVPPVPTLAPPPPPTPAVEPLPMPPPSPAVLPIETAPSEATVRELPAALPSGTGVLDEFLEAPADTGAPLPSRPADQGGGEVAVTGDMARFEHRHAGRDIGAGFEQLTQQRTLADDFGVGTHVGGGWRIPSQCAEVGEPAGIG